MVSVERKSLVSFRGEKTTRARGMAIESAMLYSGIYCKLKRLATVAVCAVEAAHIAPLSHGPGWELVYICIKTHGAALQALEAPRTPSLPRPAPSQCFCHAP